MNDYKSHIAMKTSGFKLLITAFAVGLSSISLQAQDDDGIYGDIYTVPEVNEEEILENESSPLEGYSTVDDYYPEGGYDQNDNSNQPYTEQYVDEDGKTIINNNYYGDYYEDDNDFAYSSRIRRFHRNNWGWGYYDPWYTNMYYYTYDPFFWGTSIYAGAWPGWGWNTGWGWNSWNVGFGWNNWGWGGGWNGGWGGGLCWNNWGWGWNSPYWNGYNHGYWNGFNDGLIAGGGYYNTYDPYSGIYYGPRGGGSATNGGTTIGSGYRSSTFAEVYNRAAQEGKVHHANKGNVLELADARAVKGNLDGYNVRNVESRTAFSDRERISSTEASRTGNAAVRSNDSRIGTASENVDARSNTSRTTAESRTNAYQRSNADRNTSATRTVPSSVDRSRSRAVPSRERRVDTRSRSNMNTYQRGNEATRYQNRQNTNRGNMYQDMQRTRPSTDYYQRGNSNSNRYSNPSRNQNNSQYSRPSNRQSVPSRNYQAPSRNNSTPSRTQPSRAQPSRMQPQRSTPPSRVSPQRSTPQRSVTPNRGSSNRSFSTPSPSRGSGSFSSPSRGSSSPSRSSGSRSRGGRP